MFAKIFESIYDGTLADNWQALVTFQQLLILCDEQGVVDMTPAAIHRRTGIPMDVIRAGIEVLEQPDPASRSKDMEGRRIARLDENRDWGWFLVNHATYRAKITAEQKREADRLRIADKRAAARAGAVDESPAVAACRAVSRAVADVAHTDADVDTEALHSVGKSEITDSRAPLEPEHPRAQLEAAQETPAGIVAKILRSAGITHVNPSHPKLLRLLDAGVSVVEFRDAAAEVAGKGKGNLAYVCAVIEGRRAEAQAAAAVPAKPDAAPRAGSSPAVAATPQTRHDDAVRYAAQMLGYGQIDQAEHDRLVVEAGDRLARAGPALAARRLHSNHATEAAIR